MLQRKKHPIHNEGPGSAHAGGFAHRHLSEKNLEVRLREIHSRIFPDQSVMASRLDYHRKLHEFLSAAIGMKESVQNGKNIVEAATDLHKKEFNGTSSRLRSGRQNGQKPGAVGHCNNSEDLFFTVLNEVASVRNGVLEGATFGTAINISSLEQVKSTDDRVSTDYACGHLNLMAKYIFFEDFYGKKTHAEGISEADEIVLLDERRAKLIRELKDQGFVVTAQKGKSPVLEFVGHNGEIKALPIILMMHDVTECKVHVIEGERKVAFEQWADENGLSGDPIVKSHIEAFRRHEADKDFFEDLVILMRWRKDVGCVDSRFSRMNTSVIRELGGKMDEGQMERTIATPDITCVQIDLHLKCGYLTEVMKVHEVGTLFQGLFDRATSEGKSAEVESARAMLRRKFTKGLFRGRWVGFDKDLFVRKLEGISNGQIDPAIRGFIDNVLVPPTSSVQDTVAHMYARKVMVWDDDSGTFVMPSAAKVDALLAKRGSGLQISRRDRESKEVYDMQSSRYRDLVTMQLAADEQEEWVAKVISMHGEGKIGRPIKVKVRIEDFETGKVFYNKPGDVFGKYDALTNEFIGRFDLD